MRANLTSTRTTDHPHLSNQHSSPPEAIKSKLIPTSREGTSGGGINGPVTGIFSTPRISTKTVGVGRAGMGVGVEGTGVCVGVDIGVGVRVTVGV